MCPLAKRLKTLLLLILIPLATFISSGSDSCAQDSTVSRSQNQTEITIIHVDKYGVYGPNVIFYWDTAMSKQKLDALMKAADHLRNKQAVVTYSSTGDPKKDKRPLVVDLSANTAEPDHIVREETARKEHQRPSASEEKVSLSSETPDPVDAKPNPSNAKPNFAEEKPRPPVQRKEPPEAGNESSWSEPLMDYSKKRLYGEERPPVPSPRGDSFQSGMQATFKEQPDTKPASKDSAPSPEPRESAPITREEVTGLITQLLHLNERKELNSIITYYADQVNYYDRGVVSRDYIKKDLGYYFRNWDRINTSLEGGVVLIVTDQHDLRIAKYICSFSVENAKRAVRGRSENVWKIQKINNELKIIDVKQRLIGNQ